jgi:hypothetical protein
MALMAALSTQVWHAQFCGGAQRFPEERAEPRVRLRLEPPVRVGSAA